MKHNCNECEFYNACDTYLDAPDCINPNYCFSIIDSIKNVFKVMFRK